MNPSTHQHMDAPAGSAPLTHPELMTLEEAMRYVRCQSRTSFWRWRKAKKVKPRETVGGKRFHRMDLDVAIAGRRRRF